MVLDYGAIRPQGSPHIPPTSSYSFFIEQLHSGSSMRPEELGPNQPQPFHGYHHQQIPHPHPYLHPHPYYHPSPYAHDMHAAIQREIEKEKIREEIIMSEIMRRRELEAEVRRELMMERELVLRRGSHGISFGAPPVREVDSPMRTLEERTVLPLMDSERFNGRCESGGLDPLPFQRGSADVRNSEVIPVTEVPKEKEKIILGDKPNEKASGTKREASKVDANESPSGCKARKKAKDEWNCALCKVSNNSEQALNEHLRGKKHKKKEAALKGGNKYSIGLLSKTVAVAATVDPATVYKGKASLDKTKNDTDKLNKKEKCRFRCQLCQVSAPSQKVLNSHLKGKKHKRRLCLSTKNCGDEKVAEGNKTKLGDESTKPNVAGEP